VERDHGPPAGGAASFHTTRWTAVMRAAQSQAQGGSLPQPSCAGSIGIRSKSACHFVVRGRSHAATNMFARRRGYSQDDAQDLTQSFFLHVLEHRAFSGVDRLKGKFRSFLLASFQNHISDAADRAHRFKRGGDKEFVHIDTEEAEERY